jgi:3-phenylpropionate/trans-cinnamate dioxygenase ferredoxin subunit
MFCPRSAILYSVFGNNKEKHMAFETIASTAELPSGARMVVEIGEHWVAVFNVGGNYYAVEDLCTHDDGPLAEGELEGENIVCPRHGAKFDLNTGKPTFPATAPVPRYAVRVEGDQVQVDVEQRLN